VTLVVGGAPPRAAPTGAELAAEVGAAEAVGVPRKEAMAAVAKRHGVPRRAVYDALLAARATPS
jgi:16S rRNA (cytidine1402-2'-O)-methyltransferase